jgi:magnesium and cobalt transporter
MPIAEFEAAVGIPLRQDERLADIDTVGGLVFNLAGRVPTRGEVIGHPSGLAFRVTDSDARQIRRLRASLPKTEAEAAEESRKLPEPAKS